MPKWQSKKISEEVRSPDGRIIKPGQVCWVPLDDAAKAHPLSDKAAEMKDEEGKPVYQRTSSFERQEITKKLTLKMREAAAKKHDL